MKPRGPRLIQPATSLADAIDLVSDLTAAGVAFRSLAEHIDTSPRLGGRLVVGALAALAELPLSPTHHGRRVRSDAAARQSRAVGRGLDDQLAAARVDDERVGGLDGRPALSGGRRPVGAFGFDVPALVIAFNDPVVAMEIS